MRLADCTPDLSALGAPPVNSENRNNKGFDIAPTAALAGWRSRSRNVGNGRGISHKGELMGPKASISLRTNHDSFDDYRFVAIKVRRGPCKANATLKTESRTGA